MNLLLRMKKKKQKILTIHQSVKVVDFSSLKTEKIRGFDKIKTSTIKEKEEILGIKAWT